MPRHNHPKQRSRYENGATPRGPKGKKRTRDAFRLGAQRDEHFAEADRRLREAEGGAAA